MMKSTKPGKHHYFQRFGLDGLAESFLSGKTFASILTLSDKTSTLLVRLKDYLIARVIPSLLSAFRRLVGLLKSLLHRSARFISRLFTFCLAILTLLVISAKGNTADIWQSRQQLIDTATAHALSGPAVSSLSNVRIEASPLDSRLKLRKCSKPLEAFHPFRTQISHKITVGVACNDDKPWTIFVPVAITAEYEVVNLTRSLPRGARLTRENMAEKKLRMRPNQQPFISSLENALGKELSRSLSAGTSLTHAMVRAPKVISRGDTITVIISKGALEVRSSGTALQDGSVGQKIALINSSSRRKVEGWVQTNGSVRVFH